MKGSIHSVSSVDDDTPASASGFPTGRCPVHARPAGPEQPPAPDNAPAGIPADTIDNDPVAQQTLVWVQQAVIGLNFCPFANAVLRKRRLRIHVSQANTTDELLGTLRSELQRLHDTPTEQLETSLLVCPQMLADFLDFNDFLDQADALLHTMELDGIFQIASFHPRYQFAGSAGDDIENATNQSPWPTLHLLRESSIERAVAAWGDDTDRIYENNMERLRTLGRHGWQSLRANWQPDNDDEHPPPPGKT